MDTPHAHDAAGASTPTTPCRKRYFLHGLIPQLIAFEACARHGSVTRAAHELRVAQPTASCLVRKLAITFGGPLLVRRRGHLEPTELGEQVLQLSNGIIEALARFDARERAASRQVAESRAAAAALRAPPAGSYATPPLARDTARYLQGASPA